MEYSLQSGNFTEGAVDILHMPPDAMSQTFGTSGDSLLINFTVIVESNISNISDQIPHVDIRKRPYFGFYSMAQRVTGLICYPIICVIGLIGNIFILIVLSQKNMHTSTNVFLVALACSDIIKLTNDLLYFITVFLFETNYTLGNRAYGYMYPYAHFIFNMSACVSSWLTVSVAIERYVLVCHATKAKVMCTINRSRIISVMVFSLMILFTLPSGLRYRTITKQVRNVTRLDVEVTELWRNKTFVETYNWVQNLLRSIIPLFILIFMNAFIINSLRKTRANKKMASRNRITVMLIIVIIFFILCLTPDAIMSFRFGYHEAKNYLVKGVREITDMMLAVNAAMNFFLYVVFNKVFREQFNALCCARYRGDSHPGPSATSDRQYKRIDEAHPKTVSNGTVKTPSSAQSTL